METTVAQSMATFICICLCHGWHGSRVPDHTIIINVIVLSVRVYRNIIVTVSRDSHQFRIFIETVSTTGIGDQ